MVASLRYTWSDQEWAESPPGGSDFYQIKAWCDCGDCSFRVKSIKLTAAGVKRKGCLCPEHHHVPSVYSCVHLPPRSAF